MDGPRLRNKHLEGLVGAKLRRGEDRQARAERETYPKASAHHSLPYPRGTPRLRSCGAELMVENFLGVLPSRSFSRSSAAARPAASFSIALVTVNMTTGMCPLRIPEKKAMFRSSTVSRA